MQGKGIVCCIYRKKEKSVETIPEEAETLDLFDKDFKRAVINIVKKLKMILKMYKELKKKVEKNASPNIEYH